MLYSASEELDAVLPVSFEFARSIARLYLTNLCKAATGESGESIPELPPRRPISNRRCSRRLPWSGWNI